MAVLGPRRVLVIPAVPEVDYPTIQVQTFYPGASPDVPQTTLKNAIAYEERP